MSKLFLIIALFCCLSTASEAQQMRLGLLVYNGGGDWYANPTALKNLAEFCNKNLKTRFETQEARVEVGSAELFNYPIVFATGHGRIAFNSSEAQNLREYLISGGFLHIDDNYGMDQYIRPALKSVFPELELQELPFSHPIYKQQYTFSQGVPKIHEHDKRPARASGLIWKGRLVLLYTSETDLNDGWEDAAVHNDPPQKRAEALRMGANIVSYVFMGE
jgi:hypothetical protein